MKKNFTPLMGLAFAAFLQVIFIVSAGAQTEGLGLILRVTIDGANTDYKQGLCGYETATWGGTIAEDFCAPVSWGYDITPDTLGCDSIPAGQLTGKVALIRRGACEFGLKSLNAQKGGAVMALIANNNAAANGDDCAAIPMGAGAVGAQVTIPALFV